MEGAAAAAGAGAGAGVAHGEVAGRRRRGVLGAGPAAGGARAATRMGPARHRVRRHLRHRAALPQERRALHEPRHRRAASPGGPERADHLRAESQRPRHPRPPHKGKRPSLLSLSSPLLSSPAMEASCNY
ncbi:hypothetical protein EE612_060696 [Oryza sativa]|nr:hypothetical protein EE612_060696 [Oryza sativa]